MMMVPLVYASPTQHLDRLKVNPFSFGGIGEKARRCRNSSCALRAVVVDTFALMPFVAKDFTPSVIIKKFIDYSYHAVTSMPKVVIDAIRILAYPLRKNLEGITNGRMGKTLSYRGGQRRGI